MNLSFSLFLFIPVILLLTRYALFCILFGGELCDAGGDQQIVPCDYLFDVGDMYPIPVIFGENSGEETFQLFGSGFRTDSLFPLLFFIDALKNFGKWHVFAFGKNSNLTQCTDSCRSRRTGTCAIGQRFDDDAVSALSNEFEQSALARYSQYVFKIHDLQFLVYDVQKYNKK